MPHASRAENIEAMQTYFSTSRIGASIRARVSEVINTQRIEFQANDIEIGFSYERGAIIGDGTPMPEPDPFGVEYVPSTRPGSRLPHAWITAPGGTSVSTLDLVRGRYVLLLGPKGTAWKQAAEAARAGSDLPLDIVVIGGDGDYIDSQSVWSQIKGVDDDGAILVRPDQHIAWRVRNSPMGNGEAMLSSVFAKLSGGLNPTKASESSAPADPDPLPLSN